MASQKTSGAEGNSHFTRDNLFNLSGKVALVTGGGSGIGLMATQALASNGAKVYITGRTREKLDRVVDMYNKNISGEIIAIPGDVSSKDGIEALVKQLEEKEKCLCILVNNAGVSSGKFEIAEASSAADVKAKLFDVEEAQFGDWTNTYRTNVASVYFVTVALLPLLQKSSERHDGWSATVINISSISGMIKSSQRHFSYNASKAAAIHVNRMLAAELGNIGIKVRVNSIAPGVFPSEMTTDDSDHTQKSDLEKEKFEGVVPAGRPGKDEDMAQAVLFLACNQYLNGQTVAVDGGYTLAAGQ
ncbi:rhamnolipids biosynthesis 3-oxoacyl-reductase [Plectosphaerella cucumerina]|uniref:Rhamnolipids biosynthesis 3-oxoacyl-reductase n=1 Tax=Plectosphaerella cucumerina TaxID=40658 RepID=A0A8K0X3E0_9PEZI|nr:rhamnolipids biosynthesis 3-oxoacyl-reductase [Plectosphaerella cucumerina]